MSMHKPNERSALEEADEIAATIDIEPLLARFQVDGLTKANLAKFVPILTKDIDKYATRFYEFIRYFPELRAILADHDIAKLRLAQTSYWARLFKCQFDLAYVRSSVLIGVVHRRIGLPPSLYLAGYSFFQNELYRTVGTALKPLDFVALSISINKVIALDVAIALHAFHDRQRTKDFHSTFTLI